MILVGILLLCCCANAQTYSAFIQYTTLNCVSGQEWSFVATRVTDPSGCTALACSADGNGGSRQTLCVSGSTPIPPNQLVCPTCTYCGGNTWNNSTSCAGPVDVITRKAPLACIPTPGGFYSYAACATDGNGYNQTFYVDSQCTIVALLEPIGNTRCTTSSVSACGAVSVSQSVTTYCEYGSSSTTTPSASFGSSLGAAWSTLLIVIIVATVLTQ
jgi:hypothetical protein